MHFALPPRKSSDPTPYAVRSKRFPPLRRSRIQAIALCAFAVGAILYILANILGGSDRIPSGTPPVVIITVLDSDKFSKEYIDNIKDNRIEYARKHGYTTFFPTAQDYQLDNAPNSWARIPAVRHALTKFPHSTYMWYLDQHALIMNPSYTIEGHITETKRLESLMLKDQPIVPPDSVIKTFPHLRGDQIDLVLTQDKDGLSQSSFVVKRGEWAKFFLDTWFDPLYRSYNFQKADRHALEHIVQWHPTILSKLALVPQNIMNSYLKADSAAHDGHYKDGQFVVNFAECDQLGRDCAAEAEPFSRQWKTTFRNR